MINYLSSGKVMIIRLIAGLIKKYIYYYLKWVITLNQTVMIEINNKSNKI